jgi:transposase-like protein
MAQIALDVASEFELTLPQLRGESRHGNIVLARWRCFERAYRAGYSLPQIGRFFNKDHTTVLYGLRRVGAFQPGRNKGPARPMLDDAYARQAVLLWKVGIDTCDIAKRLRVSEAAVANSLHQLKERGSAGHGRDDLATRSGREITEAARPGA